ncbi:MAG: 4a-hydroxytetrahydrobiopterin dehydratase [Crocinitomicaceae bacterium]|jgi:4a-hydroxytetrahydrobiopterin dehydratase
MELGSWNTIDGKLVREMTFTNQTEAASFVLKVAIMSDEVGHHADVEMYAWRKLRLTISTHDAGGAITEKDHKWTAMVDDLIKAN